MQVFTQSLSTDCRQSCLYVETINQNDSFDIAVFQPESNTSEWFFIEIKVADEYRNIKRVAGNKEYRNIKRENTAISNERIPQYQKRNTAISKESLKKEYRNIKREIPQYQKSEVSQKSSWVRVSSVFETA